MDKDKVLELARQHGIGYRQRLSNPKLLAFAFAFAAIEAESSKELAAVQASFAQECKDSDELLEIIGIGQHGRTDGGSINIPKVREYQKQTLTTLMQRILELESATNQALDEAIAQAVEPYKRDAERYRWLRGYTTDYSELLTSGLCAEAMDTYIDEATRNESTGRMNHE